MRRRFSFSIRKFCNRSLLLVSFRLFKSERIWLSWSKFDQGIKFFSLHVIRLNWFTIWRCSSLKAMSDMKSCWCGWRWLNTFYTLTLNCTDYRSLNWSTNKVLYLPMNCPLSSLRPTSSNFTVWVEKTLALLLATKMTWRAQN